MISTFSDPRLVDALCNGLLNWQKQGHGPEHTEHAGLIQDILGWQLALEGCMSKSCIETQSEYLHSIHSTKNPLRWLSAIIKKLWQIAWSLWDLHNSTEHAQDIALLEVVLNAQSYFSKSIAIRPMAISILRSWLNCKQIVIPTSKHGS
jgi:hypothetical protein